MTLALYSAINCNVDIRANFEVWHCKRTIRTWKQKLVTNWSYKVFTIIAGKVRTEVVEPVAMVHSLRESSRVYRISPFSFYVFAVNKILFFIIRFKKRSGASLCFLFFFFTKYFTATIKSIVVRYQILIFDVRT